ncbi:MAG: hypothetical protein ABW173_10250, partial [Sphingomonas sp.]
MTEDARSRFKERKRGRRASVVQVLWRIEVVCEGGSVDEGGGALRLEAGEAVGAEAEGERAAGRDGERVGAAAVAVGGEREA